MLPGGWDLVHAIRLGIKPFAELGANSEALSGSQVDSPCSCRAIFRIGPGSDATVSKNPGYQALQEKQHSLAEIQNKNPQIRNVAKPPTAGPGQPVAAVPHFPSY